MANEQENISGQSHKDIFDENDPKYKNIKNIQEKTIGYRMVAAIIDFAIAIFIGVLVGIFCSYVIFVPIARANAQVDEAAMAEYSNRIIVEEEHSNLFALNPNWAGDGDKSHNKWVTFYDESVSSSYATYDSYMAPTINYFTNYLTDTAAFASEANREKFTNYYYNVFILGLPDGKALYTADELDGRADFIRNNTLFEYKTDGGVVLYDEIGVPKSLSDNAKTELMAFFYSSDAKSVTRDYQLASIDVKATAEYSECIYSYLISAHWPYESDLTGNDHMYSLIIAYQNEISKLTIWQTTYPALTAIVISWIAFYLIIPLCLKNGKTLGKLFFKSAVVNNFGYEITPWQMCLRSLFPLAFIIVMYLIGMITSMLIFYIVLLFAVLASYSLTIFTKKHKSIHDYVSGTIVIDSEKSTWFKNAAAESQYQATLNVIETKNEREDRLTREYRESIEKNAQDKKLDNKDTNK